MADCFVAQESDVKTEPVKDPYLWLENVQGTEALDWVEKQNARARERLEADPRFQEFYEQALARLNAKDRIAYPESFEPPYIYNFWRDQQNVRGLLRRRLVDDYIAQPEQGEWESVIDIDQLAREENENWVYKGFRILDPEGELCLLVLSRGGKDASVFREFNLRTKNFVEGGFKIPEAKTRLCWVDRDHLLVATDFGPSSMTDSGYPREVRLLKRGQGLERATSLLCADKCDMMLAPWSFSRPNERRAVLVNRYLSFRSNEFYALDESYENLKKLDLPLDAEAYGAFKNYLLLSLRSDWCAGGRVYSGGSVVAVPMDQLCSSDARELSPELLFEPTESAFFKSLAVTRDRLYLSILNQVSAELHEITLKDGQWSSKCVELPGRGTIYLQAADSREDELFFVFQDFLHPSRLYLYGGASARLRPRCIAQLPERFDASGLKASQRWARSRDGTKVPYFVIHREKLKKNGSNPALVYAYGGFESAQTPFYLESYGQAWLCDGGVFVLANIRGGGEFGPAWHQSALRENRQRAFDDFFAVAEDLIREGITSPEHLGAMGGSNGGLLMGVALTQRPELFGGIVCSVPLLDMLRYHRLPAGASWVDEYGDPENPDHAAYLREYSPYQNLDPQKRYPEPLFTTSTLDDRVHPGHARKMAAKMEGFGLPFLYYENTEGGHAGAANLKQSAFRLALILTYFHQKLVDVL